MHLTLERAEGSGRGAVWCGGSGARGMLAVKPGMGITIEM